MNDMYIPKKLLHIILMATLVLGGYLVGYYYEEIMSLFTTRTALGISYALNIALYIYIIKLQKQNETLKS